MFNPPQANDDVKRIGKLKMKPNNFENLQSCMGVMDNENMEPTVRNTDQCYLEQIEEEKSPLSKKCRKKILNVLHYKREYGKTRNRVVHYNALIASNHTCFRVVPVLGGTKSASCRQTSMKLSCSRQLPGSR